MQTYQTEQIYHAPEEVMTAWAAKLITTRGDKQFCYKFIIAGLNGGVWVIDLAQARLVRADHSADCTIELSAETLLALANGQINPQRANLEGLIKVTGSPQCALDLHPIL